MPFVPERGWPQMLLATHILSRSQHITLLMPRDSGIQEHEMTNNKLKWTTTIKTETFKKRIQA